MPENQEELNNQTPQEFQIPTAAELLQLEIETQGLGSGETVHAMSSILGWLKNVFKKAETEGTWGNKHIQDWWIQHVGMLRREKQRRLEEIAREKRLL